MKYYELTYLLPFNTNEEEIKNTSEKIASFIQGNNGILENNYLGKRVNKRWLGHSIKKTREAFLATINFYLSPEKINNLKINIGSEKQILRYFLLTKTEPGKIKDLGIPARTRENRKEDKIPQEKVDLKDIEKKLEEILEK